MLECTFFLQMLDALEWNGLEFPKLFLHFMTKYSFKHVFIDEWSYFVDNKIMTDVCQELITGMEGYIWIVWGRNLIHQAELRGYVQSLTDETFLAFNLIYNMRNSKEISKSVTSYDGFKLTIKLLNFPDGIQPHVIENTGFEDPLQSIENAFK